MMDLALLVYGITPTEAVVVDKVGKLV